MLIDTLKADRLVAMKSKNTVKRSLLDILIADSCLQDKIPTDAKVISTINKFISSANECLKYYVEPVTIESLKEELHILQEYLPALLSDDSIKAFIVTNKFEDIGSCMKWFKTNYEGQYDGKLVNKRCQEYLNAQSTTW